MWDGRVVGGGIHDAWDNYRIRPTIPICADIHRTAVPCKATIPNRKYNGQSMLDQAVANGNRIAGLDASCLDRPWKRRLCQN